MRGVPRTFFSARRRCCCARTDRSGFSQLVGVRIGQVFGVVGAFTLAGFAWPGG